MARRKLRSSELALARDAEVRAERAPNQEEREYWQRMADYWYGQGEDPHIAITDPSLDETGRFETGAR